MIHASHVRAETGAVTAGLDTSLHLSQRGAILFASLANLGAYLREAVVELALAAKRVGGEGAKRRAIQHQS